MPDDAYRQMTERLRRIAALEQVAGLLDWDQETQMPPKGAGQRAEHSAAVAAARHAQAVDPGLADCLAALDGAELDADAAVNRAEAARIHRRATRLPAALAEDLARSAAQAHTAWLAAREADAFAGFVPALARVVTLQRAAADCLAEPGQTGYDALLAEYEPGTTAAELQAAFARLRPGLTALRAAIAASGRTAPEFCGAFPAAGQLALARRLGDVFGFDWQAGRLDLAVHPSSSGSGGDVRITTRINGSDPRECLYSTVHELGHALYEQGLDPAQAMLPAGAAASMGVHESQSRLFENQLGRSRAFCR